MCSNGGRFGCSKSNIVSPTGTKAAILVSLDPNSFAHRILLEDAKTHLRLVPGIPVNLQIENQVFHGQFLDPRLVSIFHVEMNIV